MALNAYITQVQQLLHDLSASFWTTTQLTNYINLARNRVAQDSKCLRQLITGIPLQQGVESYAIATIQASYAPTIAIIDVMGIDVYQASNTRWSLDYMPWTQFNAVYRSNVSTQSTPECYTRMGALQVYFGAIPDQAYLTDWCVAINPAPLTSDATPEPIPPPFQDCVQFFAAYMAKFQEQAMGEAAIFEKEYLKWAVRASRSFMTRVIPQPYLSG